MIVLNAAIICILILVGYNLKNLFPDFTRSEKRFLNYLFFYHLVISIAFHLFISVNGGDASFFWAYPKEESLDAIIDLFLNRSATGVIVLLNYIPSSLMQLSFLTGNLFYSTLGFLGFIYYYRISKSIFKDTTIFKKFKPFGLNLLTAVWFFPNLHFWSSGIGKDTILFLCIAIFVYSLLDIKKRWIGLGISLVFSLLIRPHIVLFLLISFGLGYVLDGRLKVYQKLLILLVFVASFVSIFNYVLEFVQLESLEISAVQEYTTTKAASLNQEDAGSGVDTSNYSLPLKIFTFLYRPFFFDMNGILGLVASIENLILLLFSVLVLRNRIISGFKNANYLLKGLLLYFLIGSIAFALILGNLGIMLRQKNMLFPLFFVFGLWVFYNRHLRKEILNEHSTRN